MFTWRWLYFYLVTACMISCTEVQPSKDLLATAYGNKLFLDEVRNDVDLQSSGSDSILLIRKYIDNWLMNQILEQKAKEEIGTDPDLEHLIRDYRREIYTSALIEKVVSASGDQGELASNVDRDTSQFPKLADDMVQFLFLKVLEVYDSDTLKNLWKTEDLHALGLFCEFRDGTAMLDIDKWSYKRTLRNIIPTKLYKKINFKKTESYSYKDSIHKFYLKILDVRKEGEELPESILEDQRRRIAIKDRSRNIIDDWKRTLFESEIQKKEIKVYDTY